MHCDSYYELPVSRVQSRYNYRPHSNDIRVRRNDEPEKNTSPKTNRRPKRSLCRRVVTGPPPPRQSMTAVRRALGPPPPCTCQTTRHEVLDNTLALPTVKILVLSYAGPGVGTSSTEIIYYWLGAPCADLGPLGAVMCCHRPDRVAMLHLHGGGRPGLRAAARGGACGSDVGTTLRAAHPIGLALGLRPAARKAGAEAGSGGSQCGSPLPS